MTIPAKDEFPKNSNISDIREAQYREQSETSGLASLLELKLMPGLCQQQILPSKID